MTKPAYSCCDRPDPAILEKNGRLFCRNCRSYLDKQSDGTKAAAATPLVRSLLEKER